jgi:SlyX protein
MEENPSTAMNDDARITPESLERIESKIAFLEQANSELSDVVFGQQRLIDTLRAQLATLEMRLQTSLDQADRPATLEDERPPHY